MQIKRAYKYRFYPTLEQEEVLARTFGCARFAYNHMLRLRTDAWFNEGKRINYHDTSAELTRLKKQPEYSWLNEVSSVPVQQALRHLQSAFSNFFARRAGYPNFHSRHGQQAATYAASAFYWNAGKRELSLARMVAPLNIRWSRTIPKAARITTVTISRDTAGRYFASLLCDDEVAALPASQGRIGIDLGLQHFLITSDGVKVNPPKVFHRYEKKLARLQRNAARKLEAAKVRAGIPKGAAIPKGTKIPKSQNWKKDQHRIKKLHAKIADSRRDFLHKLSTKLIRENQTISVETLAVKNMVKNPKLSKSISDASWSEFIRQLEYKAAWYGRQLIGIDRWYPSSKRCSVCGFTMKHMPLKLRSWQCPECGANHDRDINAARNILAAGLAVSALGETVSPATI